MYQKIYIGFAAGVVVLLVILGVWFLFFRSSSSSTTNTGSSFGNSIDNSGNSTQNNGGNSSNGTLPANGTQGANQKIFLISQGPVVGATLIQTLHPTTTLARYISQEDGHVYDLPLDVAGAVPRLVSEITIPGAYRAVWLEQGGAAILQYVDTNNVTVKSVYLGLPAATTSNKIVATRIQFLPDNIIDLAGSPDGASITYLLKASTGSDGYIARSDGTGAKKIFSLPLSQMLISWPTQGILLAHSKSAAGVPGIAFSVDAKSGATTPLVYSNDLTVTADKTFSHVIFQSGGEGSTGALTYTHDVKTGLNSRVSFNPYPEKCIMGYTNTSTMYCAAPLQTHAVNYLDQWHQGVSSLADTIYSINIATGVGTISVIPGSYDGGTASDILEMAFSPNEHYLAFTTKGMRTLWGVRLSQ